MRIVDMRDQPERMYTPMVLTTRELARLSPEELGVQFTSAELRFRNARTSCLRALTLNQLKWLTYQSRVLHVAKQQI
jgi:hypothetical protein